MLSATKRIKSTASSNEGEADHNEGTEGSDQHSEVSPKATAFSSQCGAEIETDTEKYLYIIP